MSKSIALIAFVALMGIVAVVGMSTDMSGWLAQAFNTSQVSAGVTTDMSVNNASAPASGSLAAPSGGLLQSDEGGGRMGCNHSDSYNPQDD